MPEPMELHSIHTFLFPFEWKPLQKGRAVLEDQTDLKRIIPIMDGAREKWKRMEPWSKPQKLVQYNEANYFYDFVRPVLYGDKAAKYQVHYQYKGAQGGQYSIFLTSGEQFHLELDAIGLSFYSTGVGILSFHCYNRTESDSKAILKINQYGRRLVPPFFGTNPDNVGEQAFFEEAAWESGLTTVQYAELAKSIILRKPDRSVLALEDFSAFSNGNPDLEATPGLLKQLFPPLLLSSLSISPVLDDRMFVVCWYGNDALSNSIQTRDFNQQSDDRDWWYQYIFVDGGNKTCQNEAMTAQSLKDHSNLRWSGYGTLYGVSRYSFVCLTGSLDSLKRNYASYIPTHVQTTYYKLAELALLQRGCVLRFSDEVTAISDLPDKNPDLGAHVSSLYKQYIRFVNKIYFREVTAQEQGIELYDLLQKHMRIENQVKDLDAEIEELHNYVLLLEEDRRNAKLDILTYIGALFVVPSFVCTYLGLIVPESLKSPFVLAGFCLVSAMLFLGVIRSKGFWHRVFLLGALLFTVFTLFLFPFQK